jgi:hypothetical protein
MEREGWRGRDGEGGMEREGGRGREGEVSAHRGLFPVDRTAEAPRGGPGSVLQRDAGDVPRAAELAAQRRPRVEHRRLRDRAGIPQPLERVRDQPDQDAVARSAPRNGAQRSDVLERRAAVEELRVETRVERRRRHALVEEHVLVQKRQLRDDRTHGNDTGSARSRRGAGRAVRSQRTRLDGVEAVLGEEREYFVERAQLQATRQRVRALGAPPRDALDAEGLAVREQLTVGRGKVQQGCEARRRRI